MTNRYEIDENLTVRVYMEGLEHEPWITQPDHPDARPWKDKREAEEFGQYYAGLAAQFYAESQIALLEAKKAEEVTEEQISEQI